MINKTYNLICHNCGKLTDIEPIIFEERKSFIQDIEYMIMHELEETDEKISEETKSVLRVLLYKIQKLNMKQ